MKKIAKLILWTSACLIVLCITAILVCNQMVVNHARGKAFYEIDSIAPTEIGLVLGTTPKTRIGHRRNFFFTYRIEAAEQLYKAGKVKRLLVSGDENSLDGINEPQCMKDSLIARGVPADIIFLDGKGYRTLDSVVRMCKVYGFNTFVVISQRFHNERALYQAEHLGLDVKGLQAYNAKDPNSKMAVMTYIREYLARVKMMWDILTDKQPKEFGDGFTLSPTGFEGAI